MEDERFVDLDKLAPGVVSVCEESDVVRTSGQDQSAWRGSDMKRVGGGGYEWWW